MHKLHNQHAAEIDMTLLLQEERQLYYQKNVSTPPIGSLPLQIDKLASLYTQTMANCWV